MTAPQRSDPYDDISPNPEHWYEIHDTLDDLCRAAGIDQPPIVVVDRSEIDDLVTIESDLYGHPYLVAANDLNDPGMPRATCRWLLGHAIADAVIGQPSRWQSALRSLGEMCQALAVLSGIAWMILRPGWVELSLLGHRAPHVPLWLSLAAGAAAATLAVIAGTLWRRHTHRLDDYVVGTLGQPLTAEIITSAPANAGTHRRLPWSTWPTWIQRFARQHPTGDGTIGQTEAGPETA